MWGWEGGECLFGRKRALEDFQGEGGGMASRLIRRVRGG